MPPNPGRREKTLPAAIAADASPRTEIGDTDPVNTGSNPERLTDEREGTISQGNSASRFLSPGSIDAR